MKRQMLFIVFSFMVAGAVHAQEEVIPAAVIQDLIDVSDSGSEIEIPAGVYHGVITLKENITLIGAGEGKTILDGQGAQQVITFDKEASIIGFTIRNGHTLATSKGNFIGIFECTFEKYSNIGILLRLLFVV